MTRRKGKATTTTRKATGREARLVADPMPLPLAAALDAVARQRATGEPLERALHDVAQARHLGPRERRAAGDAAFAWARRREVADRLVDEALAKTGGIKPSRRDRDLCALVLGLVAAGVDVDPRATERLPPPLDAVVDEVRARGVVGLPAELPEWLAKALASSGEDVAALTQAMALPAPLVLAVDTTKVSVDDVKAAVDATGAKADVSPIVDGALRVSGRVVVAALPASMRDAVWPMDDGSQAVARALGANAGELILDLCAGGGGKSRLLAAMGARVVSADVNASRLRAPGTSLRVVADGALPPFAPGTFDRVLVDAPCSGTGTLRRAPDLAHRLHAEDVPAFVAVQKALLAHALDIVKPGGIVVYATCSLLRDENEGVLDAVLVGGKAKAARVPIPWRNVHVDGAVGAVRLRPHTHGTDGFFVAALKRL
jgi:16S rRNA (cytosine967-C5)-methyltransferase